MKLFTASWCEPCSRLKQWLSEQDNIAHIQIIDIDEEMEQAMDACVTTIPALQVETGSELITTNERIRPFLLENVST